MVKKFTKIIVWLLVATIVVGVFGIFVVPKVAHAVDTNRPAVDGYYTAWTPSTAGSHYPMVNDSSDATYVSTTTDSNKDSYGLTAGQLPAGANVTQIKVWARAKRNHASKTASFTVFYRKDAGDTFGSSQSMTNSWADYSETWSGLSWNDTDIDNLEIGIRLDAHQAGTNPSVSEMWVEVTYYAVTSLTTDKSDYPTVGETITVDSTIKNGSSAIISGSTADYVIFIDANGDHQPTTGETYITSGCAGSGSWASGNYTRQWSVPNVAVDGTQSDNWTCSNSNFPQNTTYHVWLKWYSGATTYDTAYVTFTSVPTLGEVLFVILLGVILFFVIRLIWLFKKKRHWLFYYLMASFSLTLALIFLARHFGIDQKLVNVISYHLYLLANFFKIPIELLSNGRLLLLQGNHSILKLGIECSAVIESSILISLMLFFPLFSLRQRLLRIFFGLVITYVINLLRLLIIVLMANKFGPDYIFLAHAGVGRLFFFIAELLLYWFLFTKPMVKSVGDSIKKNIPLAITARSGHSLQWRYTYGQAIVSLGLAIILASPFGFSNVWQKAFVSQLPKGKQILGQEIIPYRIEKLEPNKISIQVLEVLSNQNFNLKIIEGKEPLLIEVYVDGRFQNRSLILPDQNNHIILEAKAFEKSIETKKGDNLKLIFKNIGAGASSYSMEMIN